MCTSENSNLVTFLLLTFGCRGGGSPAPGPGAHGDGGHRWLSRRDFRMVGAPNISWWGGSPALAIQSLTNPVVDAILTTNYDAFIPVSCLPLCSQHVLLTCSSSKLFLINVCSSWKLVRDLYPSPIQKPTFLYVWVIRDELISSGMESVDI
jgi:hypothetical protein